MNGGRWSICPHPAGDHRTRRRALTLSAVSGRYGRRFPSGSGPGRGLWPARQGGDGVLAPCAFSVGRTHGGDAGEVVRLVALGGYTGCRVHDALAFYLKLSGRYSLCNAHLLRDLTAVHEETGQAWAAELIRLLIQMKGAVAPRRSAAQPGGFGERPAQPHETNPRAEYSEPLDGASPSRVGFSL